MLEQNVVKTDVLLEVNGLKKYYPVKKGMFGNSEKQLKAVDEVSFDVKRGETFSIVGESGCGKSTTGMCLLRLIDPTSGEVLFNNENILMKNKTAMKEFRKEIQVVFQDPYSSLNPKHTVKKILSEPFIINKTVPRYEIENEVINLLKLVGLDEYHMERYPHEFSGGQRQRIGIARALALKPQLIVCDEPVSALDVSIQSQILNLLKKLQEQFNLTYIFISHDLSVVEQISDRVAVMYLGKIVEIGTRDEIFNTPKHPYTQALLSSVPVPDPKVKRLKQKIILEGDLPSPENPPAGCYFYSRCPVKTEKCKEVYPDLKEVSNHHQVSCHLI
ncbi:ABC transporter ATP-binding protein [Neobacillus citreus]|uniref:Dipeptide ABC transporter ATP-binding protein n=1 Tax=Neobacillus citreus TaxID=2833578 RepID=A0A942YBI6_9BACI|nr:dipeptide ABC transporter ATP-binding protein [Neobacillus citreus]MCH6266418.1 dipeptide ABC transporter ATP-binding protein [Neobacillus citreus]